VEAHVVHTLERLVAIPAHPNRPTTPPALHVTLDIRHGQIIAP
jgi:hypothetical protein